MPRGGKRAGAGRKPKGYERRVSICTRIDAEMFRKLEEMRGETPLGMYLDELIAKASKE